MRRKRIASGSAIAVAALLLLPAAPASAQIINLGPCQLNQTWSFGSDWAASEDYNGGCTQVSVYIYFNPPGTTSTIGSGWRHDPTYARQAGKELISSVHGAY